MNVSWTPLNGKWFWKKVFWANNPVYEKIYIAEWHPNLVDRSSHISVTFSFEVNSRNGEKKNIRCRMVFTIQWFSFRQLEMIVCKWTAKVRWTLAKLDYKIKSVRLFFTEGETVVPGGIFSICWATDITVVRFHHTPSTCMLHWLCRPLYFPWHGIK